MNHKNGLPKEITKTLYVCMDARYPTGISIWDTDMADHGYIVLCTHEVTVQIPDFDIVNGQIQVLRDEKQKILAEAQVKANAIEERISSLLAIEHTEGK